MNDLRVSHGPGAGQHMSHERIDIYGGSFAWVPQAEQAQEQRKPAARSGGLSRVDGVEADSCRRKAYDGATAYEALWMSFEGGIQARWREAARRGHAAEEDVGRRGEREARVAVAVGVPVEELGGPSARVSRVAEATGVVRLVLHGLEAGLGERVVVGDARPAEAALDAELVEHACP